MVIHPDNKYSGCYLVLIEPMKLMEQVIDTYDHTLSLGLTVVEVHCFQLTKKGKDRDVYYFDDSKGYRVSTYRISGISSKSTPHE